MLIPCLEQNLQDQIGAFLLSLLFFILLTLLLYTTGVFWISVFPSCLPRLFLANFLMKLKSFFSMLLNSEPFCTLSV